MKAIVYTQYGAPDVLRLEDVEKPTPKEDEVLVRVHAAAANPLDWRHVRGTPLFFRLQAGLLAPKQTRLGADVAGRVEAVGSRVTRFRQGDAVFGDIGPAGLGAFAEYACAPETLLALKPDNLPFEEAAAVPVAAITALQGLRMGKIQTRQTVLINGASGGVGTFAVQIAKSFGAQVTGVCSTHNLDLVRSIGADHAIDYTREDFTRTGRRYDLIFDAVGNRSVADYARALRPQGQCVVAGFTTLGHLVQVMLLGAWVSRNADKTIGIMATAVADKDDLLVLKEMIEAGTLTPVIDRHYPLAETADAIRYLERGHARGKVIITVAEESAVEPDTTRQEADEASGFANAWVSL